MVFDSILVRLKGGYAVLKPGDLKFRFHTGSIKRPELASMKALIDAFRFHTGSIKRKHSRVRHPLGCRAARLFRFHTGSIKSVRSFMLPDKQEHVSIPYWFD